MDLRQTTRDLITSVLVKLSLNAAAKAVERWNRRDGLGLMREGHRPEGGTPSVIVWSAGNCLIAAHAMDDQMDDQTELEIIPFRKTPPDEAARLAWNGVGSLFAKAEKMNGFDPIHPILENTTWANALAQYESDKESYKSEWQARVRPNIALYPAIADAEAHSEQLWKETHLPLLEQAKAVRDARAAVANKAPADAAKEYLASWDDLHPKPDSPTVIAPVETVGTAPPIQVVKADQTKKERTRRDAMKHVGFLMAVRDRRNWTESKAMKEYGGHSQSFAKYENEQATQMHYKAFMDLDEKEFARELSNAKQRRGSRKKRKRRNEDNEY